MSKLKKDLKKVTPRTIIILLLVFAVSLLWFRYVAALVLLIVFIPITFFTVRYAKIVPHISIESNTAMTIFMGYVFGPWVALIYGPIVGGTSYAINGVVTPPSISTVFLSGIGGVIAYVLKVAFDMNFTYAFILAIIIRTVLAFPWMMMFVDPIESFTHQTTQLFSNLILYLPLLSALHSVVAPFV